MGTIKECAQISALEKLVDKLQTELSSANSIIWAMAYSSENHQVKVSQKALVMMREDSSFIDLERSPLDQSLTITARQREEKGNGKQEGAGNPAS